MVAHFRIRLGSRTLAATWPLTLLTVAAVAAFSSLGHWQWTKGNLRARQADAFARGSEVAEPLGGRSLGALSRFQRIRVSGRFDPSHQFLLDNRTNAGRPGYEVLTPFERATDAGSPSAADQDDAPGTWILVDRGWVPFSGFRDKLPDVSFSAGNTIELAGRIDDLPVEGLASGRAAPEANVPWPKVTSFPHAEELAAALGRPVESRILLLDADEPNGYVRTWQPPGLTPVRHWAYGVQWYAFAALAIVLWVILGFRRGPQS